MVLDGRDLSPKEFYVSGQGREGTAMMLADARRVEKLLAGGATVVLDVRESLAPGVAALTRALGSPLGAAVGCSLAAGDAPVVDWLLGREMFLASDLIGECSRSEASATATLDRLATAGVVESV